MRTVIFSFVLTYLVSTLVIFILWVQYRKRYNGTTYLVYNFALQTLGLLLIVLRGKIPDWISIDFANTILIAGIIIGYIGLEAYTGKKTNQTHNYILLIVFASVHTWFTYYHSDLAARNLNISVISLLIFIQSAWLMLYRVPRKSLSLTHSIGLVFIAFSLVCLANIAKFIFGGKVMPADYFDSGRFDTIVTIIYHMLVILLTYSLVLMYSKNLLMDIKSEEEKFSTAFNKSRTAIILSGFPDDRIIEANYGFLTNTGFDYSEVVGKSTGEIQLWDNEEEWNEAFKELSLSGKVNEKEYKFRTKSGDIITCLYWAEVIIVGNEKCLLSGFENISERKLYDEVIRHERNLLRTLIDNLPDPVSIKDKEGRYLLNNKAHLEFLGEESREEVMGKTLYDFFPEKDAVRSDEDDKNVMRTGRMILDKVESDLHRETGFPYLHLTSKIPILNSRGIPIQLITIRHDITERKKAEDSLKDSAEFNRSLLMTIPFGMDIVDENGTILFLNEKLKDIFGPDGVGKKCWDLYRDDKRQCSDCPLVKGIVIGKTEIYESHGIAGEKVFDIYHTGMMYHGKKAMLEVFHDITEHKHTEDVLLKSKEKAEESDRLKSAFLHNISHEIRTPMNAIVGFTTLLGEPDISAINHQAYLEIITQSSNHLLSIVTDIIEVANIEAGKMRLNLDKVKINSLFDNLYKQFAPTALTKEIEFRCDIPHSEKDIYVYTDSTKLVQVISNLLANSFKFTRIGRIVFGYTIINDSVEVFVSDTGIGIPDDHKKKIFDFFYQVDSSQSRQYEGTGLGLSLAKSYVEFLGGTIRFTSDAGKGSSFFVSLPSDAVRFTS